MDEFGRKLNSYAELVIRIGVNLKKGQKLVINAPVISADFVRLLVEKAYEAGARDVHVDWNDGRLNYLRFKNVSRETLGEYPLWRARGYEEMAKEGAAFLYVNAPNPDLLKDIDAEKISISTTATNRANRDFHQYLDREEASWCVVAFSTPEWSRKVFPGLEAPQANSKLWENIFKICRVNTDDPVQAWNDHVSNLEKYLNYLNEKKYKALIYSAPGTSLEVGLPDNHVWEGGGTHTVDGTFFIPNIPTEEVFTMPHRERVNGTLKATMPLNHGGKLIEDFSFEFRNGRIVKATAGTGEDMLKQLIETDDGSHYLGEVAIVPHDSPISGTGLMFYNTLFDENASCHFAMGQAYPTCLEGGSQMDDETLTGLGANTSLIHIDFMVGSDKLRIEGVTSQGKREPIMIDGNWSI